MKWLLKERKYWKPTSVTWWSAVAPGLVGCFIVSEPLHELATLTEVARGMTGGVPPEALIQAMFFGVGIRGAV